MRDAAAALRDYYDVLGVARDADDETLKRAFRRHARALHPDVSADPAAAAKFGELSEAYGVLSKESTRRLYDHFGYRGRGNGWFTPEGAQAAGDFLHRRARPVAEVLVDELEAERGVRRRLRWQRVERCAACAGEGGAPGAVSRACPGCNGSGRRRSETSLPDGERLIQLEDCGECRGRGRLLSEPCRSCGGVGRRTSEEAGEVLVPAGAADGDRLQVQGLPRFVTVRVLAAPRDQPLVRLVAVAGLVVALVFLALLLR